MVAFTSRESVLLSILVSGIEKGSKGGILSLGMPKKKNKAIKPYFRIMKY